MKDNMLDIVIRNYEHFIGKMNYDNLPDRESEEYRTLILKTANEKIFFDGRYSAATEYTQEIFDDEEVKCDLADLKLFNSLTPLEQQKLRFFLDLKKVCYPLFRGQEVDWTAWPWNLKDGTPQMHNEEMWDFIKGMEYDNLKAAIMYDLYQQIWLNDTKYTSVMRNELSRKFQHEVKNNWGEDCRKDDECKSLGDHVFLFMDELWSMENHLLVGKELGFDFLAQSIYDAIDTYISMEYDYRQIMITRELRQWLEDNWPMGENKPGEEKLRALADTLKGFFEKHHLEPTDLGYTFDILTMDVLDADVE